MSVWERWAEFIYQASRRPLKARIPFTAAGVILWFGITALFIIVALKVDDALGFPGIVPSPLNFILGLPIAALGAFICEWMVMLFARTRGTPVPLNPPPKLIATGLYARVRNPMISGWFILLVGLGILFRSLSLLFIFTPLFVILNVLYLKAIEEREMEKKFGAEYLRYKREVPMFLPRFERIRLKRRHRRP